MMIQLAKFRDALQQLVRETEDVACASMSSAEGAARATRRTAVVCVAAALCLTLWFYTMRDAFTGFTAWGSATLGRGLVWAGAMVISQLLIPALVVKLLLRERLRDHGLNLRLRAAEMPLYGGLLVFMLGLVWGCSGLASFQAAYPFFQPPAGQGLWPLFWLWEAVYLLTFVATEFFFRGFLIHGLKPRLGFSAVFVAMVPYCLVHFGKPLPETLGSIIAGLVLGVLSLKSRSILPGVLLHGGVALGMDLAALWHKGLLF